MSPIELVGALRAVASKAFVSASFEWRKNVARERAMNWG
jgi:hypothetical protein